MEVLFIDEWLKKQKSGVTIWGEQSIVYMPFTIENVAEGIINGILTTSDNSNLISEQLIAVTAEINGSIKHYRVAKD